MKEFIDKLISRFKKVSFADIDEQYADDGQMMLFLHDAISIVNELAEEYESWVMIDGQYCWQTCGATEHCKECRRFGNGDIDYYESIGEYINCSTDTSADCSTKVSEMPTGWIPCSVNKHNEIHVAEKMWVTMRNKESKYCFVRRLMWNGCLRRWEWDNGKQISDMWEVVAWKKIDVPAPYTEGE